MKKVYLFIFIGILAIILVTVSVMTFNPKVETWSSIFAGAACGILIIKFPAITAYFKNRRQKSVK